MNKTIVAYFSKSGNNRFLAERLAETLQCEVVRIEPANDNFMGIMFSSLFGAGMRIKKPRLAEENYEKVLLCGPIWAGQLLAPLRTFLKNYCAAIPAVYFATCCGSGDDAKDGKFGYERVFAKVRKVSGERCKACMAFPIAYAVPEEFRNDDETVMKTQLSDSAFKGELGTRFEKLVGLVK